MTKKTCFACGVPKPLSGYYRCKRWGAWVPRQCKECYAAKVRANRLRNADHYREYDRARNRSAARRAHRAASAIRFAAKHPHKRKAHIAVGNAVRDGRLTKRPCERCGRKDSHGHHDDYSKLLEVTWLCPVHHAERHKELTAAQSAGG